MQLQFNDNDEREIVREVTEYGALEKSKFINIYFRRLNRYLNKTKKGIEINDVIYKKFFSPNGAHLKSGVHVLILLFPMGMLC